MAQNTIDIAFVILHYNTIDATHNCVDSIREQIDTLHYAIVIVDNASPNGTGALLEKEYSGKEHLHVILSKENCGFARGNNLGIDYARDTLQAPYVCCLNNDVILLERHFYRKLKRAYSKKRWSVLGPMIIDKERHIVCGFPKKALLPKSLAQYVKKFAPKEVLPPKAPARSIKETVPDYVIKENAKSSLHRLLKSIVPLRALVLIARGLKKSLRIKARRLKRSLHVGAHKLKIRFCRLEGVLVHGCCMVFSPLYFEHYKGLDPATFMFFEEELLYAHLIKDGLQRTTLYLPSIIVQHMEGGATATSFNDDSARRAFRYKYCKESLDIIKAYIKQNGIDCD